MIVAFTGLARSGKDTAAAHLAVAHGFVRFAFADALKKAAAEAFGVPLLNFYYENLKDEVDPYWGISPRTMLQKMGTEAMRGTFGDDFWIKRMQLDMLNAGRSVVISDLRTDAEAAAIRKMGGTIILVERDGAGLEGENGKHSSEAGVSEEYIDYFAPNNGPKSELYVILDFIMSDRIGEKK